MKPMNADALHSVVLSHFPFSQHLLKLPTAAGQNNSGSKQLRVSMVQQAKRVISWSLPHTLWHEQIYTATEC